MKNIWPGLVLLGLDRLGKCLVLAKEEWLISSYLKIELVKSPGWFWQPVNSKWLSAVSAAIVAVLIYQLARVSKKETMMIMGLSLIIAGGVSNLYDRLVYNYVVDWLWTAVYPWAVVNLSDVMIGVGVGIIIYLQLKSR